MRLAHRIVTGCVAIASAISANADAQACRPYDVPANEIREAMRQHGNYDIRATMNAARFGAEVILRLARWARARDSTGGPLIIRHDAWFNSFLEVGVMRAEEAPIGARMAYQYHQDMEVDYRTERVVSIASSVPPPLLALRIRAWIPEGPATPTQYSYADTLSVPKLRVTVGRVVTFNLLDYGDRVVYDRMSGVKGRPTSGALGALFALLGDARIERSQIAAAADGVQIMVASAKWLFTRTETATIDPSGHGDKGVPGNRPDLKQLESRLRAWPSIAYLSPAC